MVIQITCSSAWFSDPFRVSGDPFRDTIDKNCDRAAVWSHILPEWSCSDNSKAATGCNLAQAESKSVGSYRTYILFFKSAEESAYVNLDKFRFYKQ